MEANGNPRACQWEPRISILSRDDARCKQSADCTSM
jgi:hypothetical protein